MNKNELIQVIREMIASAPCCPELKKAGQDYLDAASAEIRKASARNLLQEIREDVATIDQALGFYQSPMALELFGAELRQTKIERAQARKAAGEKWCDCAACAAGLVILEHADLLD